jgi:uncharacterized protein YuzE
MRIRSDSDADVLVVVVRAEAAMDSVEEPGGVVVSYGEDGRPVSVEFLHAAVRNLVQADGLTVTLEGKAAQIAAG